MSKCEIYVEGMIESSKHLVLNYSQFVQHAPKLLRQSMMLAYQTAVDDMMKAMDKNLVNNPIIHDQKKVVLLDDKGHAAT